jgi:hypothetical protein
MADFPVGSFVRLFVMLVFETGFLNKIFSELFCPFFLLLGDVFCGGREGGGGGYSY